MAMPSSIKIMWYVIKNIKNTKQMQVINLANKQLKLLLSYEKNMYAHNISD